MDFARGMSGLLVKPEGSYRAWLNLSTMTFNGTPYCSAMEMPVAKESMSPEIVDPSLDIVMKTSPGVWSSNIPTVMYPSWPAMLNLCVIDFRSSGRRRRAGTSAFVLCFLPLSSGVLRGCVRFQPSRYTAMALSPSRHPSTYDCMISSAVTFVGRLTVLEMAPERNGWTADIILMWPMYWIDRSPFAGLNAQPADG